MSDAKKPATTQSFEERKKALIAQGAARRQNIDTSIAIIRDNLHADKLAKSAMSHLTAKVYGSVDRLFGRHRAEKVDLSELDPDAERSAAYESAAGLAGKFAELTNQNHAAGRMIATARRLLPLAATAFSILRRRQLIMPVVRGAAVLGGIGAGAYLLHRYRQNDAHSAADDELDNLPYLYPADADVAGMDGQGALH